MKTNTSLTGLLSILFLCLTLMVPACGPKVKIKHQPVQFSEAPLPHGKDKFPNWPVPPDMVEGELYRAGVAMELEIKMIKRTAHGTAGAFREDIYFPTIGKEVRFKFKKAIPGSLDSFNTSPRRELAAYQVQKFFLEPEDYVVPTSIAVCAPRDVYEKNHGYTAASVEGTTCVFGLASIWLENLTVPNPLYEESRFLKEPNYAHFLSNLNLLTYLIAHRDAREGNFLVSKDEKRRQAFSIDNGMSFGSWPRNYFSQNWDVIIVPALRKDSIDRLRQLQRRDLDVLGVVVQFQKDEKGILKPVSPSDNLDPKTGVRIQGGTVQLGLKKSEIDDVWERIVSLIADVDSGKIPVF
ncbi:MAG: hypothetical protein JSV47_05285 [Deltaproteobacteria bacterium]|nr:MAG: hypothetical protein JSV47_05285 [Deltaproteobacteria bacterium]